MIMFCRYTTSAAFGGATVTVSPGATVRAGSPGLPGASTGADPVEPAHAAAPATTARAHSSRTIRTAIIKPRPSPGNNHPQELPAAWTERNTEITVRPREGWLDEQAAPEDLDRGGRRTGPGRVRARQFADH